MFIQLKPIFENVGWIKEFDYELEPNDISSLSDFNFIFPISVKGQIENKVGIVILTMNLSFSQQCSCDRCLEKFNDYHSFSCEHILVSEKYTEDDEYILIDNFKLDLNDLVVTNVLLNLPSKNLCEENCLGLCYQCGTNLNIGKCKCEKTQIDPRLEALSQLIK